MKSANQQIIVATKFSGFTIFVCDNPLYNITALSIFLLWNTCKFSWAQSQEFVIIALWVAAQTSVLQHQHSTGWLLGGRPHLEQATTYQTRLGYTNCPIHLCIFSCPYLTLNVYYGPRPQDIHLPPLEQPFLLQRPYRSGAQSIKPIKPLYFFPLHWRKPPLCDYFIIKGAGVTT